MRLYSFDPASAKIARLYTLTRKDETVLRFTSWSAPITIGADTWSPGVGLTEYSITERNDGTPASTQFDIALSTSNGFEPDEVFQGMFDGAELEIDVCDAGNPTQRHFHFYGTIFPTAQALHNHASFEARNPHAFPRFNLVPTYTVMCRHSLGDRFCGVPVMRPEVRRSTAYVLGDTVRKLTGVSPGGYGNVYFEVTTAGTTAGSAPTFDYAVGNTTTDGSVVFTARNAFERACEIDLVPDRHNMTLTALPDPRASDASWFNPGKIMFTSGRNKNRVVRIGYWDPVDKLITTFLPAALLTVSGDEALIWPDCNKTLAMCDDKFDRARFHGGFPYFEGAKAVGD